MHILEKTEIPEFRRDNIKVFYVSPIQVQQQHNIVLADSGSGLKYSFIPCKPFEFWINSDYKFDQDATKSILYKELISTRYMLMGIKHDEAHDKAMKLEAKARRNGNLDKVIKSELDKDIFKGREPSVYNGAKHLIVNGSVHHAHKIKMRHIDNNKKHNLIVHQTQ